MSNTVPDGWSNPILGKVFSLLRGSVIPNENPNEKFDYYSLPIFDQTGSSATVLGSEIESNKTLITEQAILVSKLNPRKPRVQLVKEAAGLRRCASTEFMAYAPKSSGVSLPFYKYYFLSEYFSGRLQLVATGSTNSHVRVTPGETLRWSIPHPPLPEQQKIAAILSSVDDVIEKTRAQIDKLKDLKTGMMQELLTKGIGHTAFKDSPVGRIPESWEVTTLGAIVVAKGLQTGPFGSQLHAHEYIERGVPVVMPKDMKNNGVDATTIAHIPEEKAEKLAKHRVRAGDILFARRGDIGRFALIEKGNEGWLCGTGCLKARFSDSINPTFISCYLTLTPVVEWLNLNAVGQTMLNLNTSILADLPVILPPKNEQSVIGDAISSLDDRVRCCQEKLGALQSVKKALMQDLLTGKVRVNVDNKETAVA